MIKNVVGSPRRSCRKPKLKDEVDVPVDPEFREALSCQLGPRNFRSRNLVHEEIIMILSTHHLPMLSSHLATKAQVEKEPEVLQSYCPSFGWVCLYLQLYRSQALSDNEDSLSHLTNKRRGISKIL